MSVRLSSLRPMPLLAMSAASLLAVACARPMPPVSPASSPDEDPSEAFDEPGLDEPDPSDDPTEDDPPEEAPAEGEEPLGADALEPDLDDLERALLDLE